MVLFSLKNDLAVPTARVLSERCIDRIVLGRRYDVEKDFNPSEPLDLRRFVNSLNSKQRIVVALTALERCEPLDPIKISCVENWKFLEKVWNVSCNIDGWLYSGFVPAPDSNMMNTLRNLFQAASQSINFAPNVPSMIVHYTNLRKYEVLECAVRSVETFGKANSDSLSRAVYACSNAVECDEILNGFSEDDARRRRSKTISEVINRAMCRLAFHDAYEAVLQ